MQSAFPSTLHEQYRALLDLSNQRPYSQNGPVPPPFMSTDVLQYVARSQRLPFVLVWKIFTLYNDRMLDHWTHLLADRFPDLGVEDLHVLGTLECPSIPLEDPSTVVPFHVAALLLETMATVPDAWTSRDAVVSGWGARRMYELSVKHGLMGHAFGYNPASFPHPQGYAQQSLAGSALRRSNFPGPFSAPGGPQSMSVVQNGHVSSPPTGSTNVESPNVDEPAQHPGSNGPPTLMANGSSNGISTFPGRPVTRRPIPEPAPRYPGGHGGLAVGTPTPLGREPLPHSYHSFPGVSSFPPFGSSYAAEGTPRHDPYYPVHLSAGQHRQPGAGPAYAQPPPPGYYDAHGMQPYSNMPSSLPASGAVGMARHSPPPYEDAPAGKPDVMQHDSKTTPDPKSHTAEAVELLSRNGWSFKGETDAGVHGKPAKKARLGSGAVAGPSKQPHIRNGKPQLTASDDMSSTLTLETVAAVAVASLSDVPEDASAGIGNGAKRSAFNRAVGKTKLLENSVSASVSKDGVPSPNTLEILSSAAASTSSMMAVSRMNSPQSVADPIASSRKDLSPALSASGGSGGEGSSSNAGLSIPVRSPGIPMKPPADGSGSLAQSAKSAGARMMDEFAKVWKLWMDADRKQPPSSSARRISRSLGMSYEHVYTMLTLLDHVEIRQSLTTILDGCAYYEVRSDWETELQPFLPQRGWSDKDRERNSSLLNKCLSDLADEIKVTASVTISHIRQRLKETLALRDAKESPKK
eukprot:ANDGO_03260.mRNA.1 hypothetical protein